MDKHCRIGKSSLRFPDGPRIITHSSLAGKKEGEGPLGPLFDRIYEDATLGEDSWEKAESTLQQEAAKLALKKAGLSSEQIRYLFGGDLLGQIIATSFGVEELNIPVFGLYGACSVCGEALSLAAMTVAAGYAERAMAVTSSHFASAEKQFRFPLGYGNQRPLSATWTVTGAGAFIVAPKGGAVKISGITTGKVVDFGVKDSMNMGACMAPAACDTICQHLKDFGRQPKDYDRIFTGDLGLVGQKILIKLLRDEGIDLASVHDDCGIEMFDSDTQDTHAGGSGAGCSAAVLSALILPKLQRGDWKRVLFVPTGALLSTVSFNEGQSVPGIAHGLVLEHCEEET